MAWDRQYIRNHVKSYLLLDRSIDDGLYSNSLLNEAIEQAMKVVAIDCNLFPVKENIALIADQYEYPMPNDVLRIKRVWYKNSSGNYKPLIKVDSGDFLDYVDPTETENELSRYCYPVTGSHVFNFYAGAPPTYDYVYESYVTEGTIRTIVDSGINFGRTLSGKRIRPKNIAHNLTDTSYGYVSHLNVGTAKESGTATGNTSSTILEDTTATFSTNNVAVDDVICKLSGSTVISYAFVTAVTSETRLTYTGFEAMAESATSFASGDTYKVGTSHEVWLSTAAPYRGLREGANNYFSVGSAKATITGTTFTNTTVTGSSTSGAEADDIAIASGGSHGKITTVDDNELTIDKWIGGLPTAAETVTVKACDKYRIEEKFQAQKMIWLGKTIDTSDTVGDESVVVIYNRRPLLPDEDDDPIEIPEEYEEPLLRCCEWQAILKARLAVPLAEVIALQTLYRETVKRYAGNIFNPPEGPTYPKRFGRSSRSRATGSRYTTQNGISWDVADDF